MAQLSITSNPGSRVIYDDGDLIHLTMTRLVVRGQPKIERRYRRIGGRDSSEQIHDSPIFSLPEVYSTCRSI